MTGTEDRAGQKTSRTSTDLAPAPSPKGANMHLTQIHINICFSFFSLARASTDAYDVLLSCDFLFEVHKMCFYLIFFRDELYRDKDYLLERRDLAIDFIFCLVSVEVLKQVRFVCFIA